MIANPEIDKAKYRKLVSRVSPMVINSEAENERILAEIAQLMRRPEGSLSPEESALFDLMVKLVEDFEAKAYPIDTSDRTPLDALKFLMEQNELTPAELARQVGVSRGNLTDVLKGRREISKELARELAKRFKLSVAAFI